MDGLLMPLKKALVPKLGLGQSTPLALIHSIVWQSGADMMFEERLTLLMRLLNTTDTKGKALGGAVMRLQQWVGCEEPVLQTNWMSCRCVSAGLRDTGCGGMRNGCKTSCGWSGTWVGMVYMTLGDLGMQITGGEGMPKLRVGDRCLVDLAMDDERDMVRIGCLATEVWRCSEALQLDGHTLSRQFDPGGSAEKTAGKEWCRWVRHMLGSVGNTKGLVKQGEPVHVPVLGRWLTEHCWSWQLVAWKEG